MINTCVTLLNLVDERRCRTLARLEAIAKRQGVDVLLLGAFARDLLFWHTHGISCHRGTMDVDIVVQLQDWTAYNRFRSALQSIGFKSTEAAHPEKLLDTDTGVEVDLLPFGDIAEDGKTVVWPQDDSRWSVIGIQDAYDHALRFEIIVDGITRSIRFVSASGLVLLKIVAIYDRPEARYKKDTADIGFVIDHYLGIGNKVRMESHPHEDILRAVDGDLDRATARLLGRDISEMVSSDARAYIVNLLKQEVRSRSTCRFTQGLQESLCKGSFSRARIIVGEILDGLMWTHPARVKAGDGSRDTKHE